MDLQEARQQLIEKIKTYHPESGAQIDAFFSRVVIQAAAGGFAMLTADNAFIKDWVESHYKEDIQRGMSDLYGGDWMIAMEIDNTAQSQATNAALSKPANDAQNAQKPSSPESIDAHKFEEGGTDAKKLTERAQSEGSETKSSRDETGSEENEKDQQDEKPTESSNEEAEQEKKQTRRRTDSGEIHLTFDNYITGDSNQMAFRMALEVAEKPGITQFNPLFIYGKSGVGKTHLLCAIKNHLEEHRPELKIRYIDAMEMVNEYGQAAINKTFKEFEDSFKSLDVLLVDDIQMLAKKQQTVDALFRIFNDLIPKGKQFVFSSDRDPQQIEDIDERYKSRFTSGGTVDVTPPDAETKRNIAKSFLEECQENEDFPLELSDDVLDYIAENSGTNVRELKSAVTNVVFALRLSPDHTITRREAKQLLANHFTTQAGAQVSMDAIKDEICSFYGVTRSELEGPGRSKKIKLPRSVAIYLCRELLECTFATIGEGFGRTHSTIMHSYEVFCTQMKEDVNLQDEVDDIKTKLEKQ